MAFDHFIWELKKKKNLLGHHQQNKVIKERRAVYYLVILIKSGKACYLSKVLLGNKLRYEKKVELKNKKTKNPTCFAFCLFHCLRIVVFVCLSDTLKCKTEDAWMKLDFVFCSMLLIYGDPDSPNSCHPLLSPSSMWLDNDVIKTLGTQSYISIKKKKSKAEGIWQ